MFSEGSRKLLCILLTAMMTIGVCVFSGAVIINSTLCTHSYMRAFFCTEKISTYCHNVYNERIALLSENSDIPVRVFALNSRIHSENDFPVDRFFSNGDTTFLTIDNVNAYENLIKEYLDGNNISYDNELVHNTAVKAAEIYSDSFGVKNIEPFRIFVDNMNDAYDKVLSTGALIIMVPMILLYMLFSDKKNVYKCYTSALTASGMSLSIAAIIGLIIGVGRRIEIYPQVYEHALRNAISVMLVIMLAAGAAIIALSVFLSLRQYKLTKKTAKK